MKLDSKLYQISLTQSPIQTYTKLTTSTHKTLQLHSAKFHWLRDYDGIDTQNYVLRIWSSNFEGMIERVDFGDD